MEEFIRQENLRRFRERLAVEEDPTLRQLLENLIAQFSHDAVSRTKLPNDEAEASGVSDGSVCR